MNETTIYASDIRENTEAYSTLATGDEGDAAFLSAGEEYAQYAPKAKAKPTKEGLVTAQVRILQVLAKQRAGHVLTQHEIADQANVPFTHIRGFVFTSYSTKKTLSLWEQGFVAKIAVEDAGKRVNTFEITLSGREALKANLAAKKAKADDK